MNRIMSLLGLLIIGAVVRKTRTPACTRIHGQEIMRLTPCFFRLPLLLLAPSINWGRVHTLSLDPCDLYQLGLLEREKSFTSAIANHQDAARDAAKQLLKAPLSSTTERAAEHS